MTNANRGIYRLTLGDFTVTALNDGQFEAAAEWVAGIDGSALEQHLVENFRPFPPRITLNAFLVEHGDHKVLIDAGAGKKFMPSLGSVASHLATLGVEPGAIGTILLTHAHVDHVGGLTDDAGTALFPHATVMINEVEAAFWRDDAIMAGAPEGAKGSFLAARAALDAYGTRVRTFGDGAHVFAGIRARSLPGHTPGHTGFLIGEGAQALLIWGDIVHLPGVQYDRPEVGMVFDADGARAIETRKAIFAEVVADRLLFAGMHLDFPTFGHLRRHADRVEAVPLVWAPTA